MATATPKTGGEAQAPIAHPPADGGRADASRSTQKGPASLIRFVDRPDRYCCAVAFPWFARKPWICFHRVVDL